MPLEEDGEQLARGLVGFAVTLADGNFQDKDFVNLINEKLGTDILIDQNIGKRNRIIMELTTYNLFLISIWMMGNYKNQPTMVLDRMYFLYREAIDEDGDSGFIPILRHASYQAASKNQAGAGPMWHLGKEVAKYILGEEKEDWVLPVMIAGIGSAVTNSLEKFVISGDYKNLSQQ